jgi:O-antigen ligase
MTNLKFFLASIIVVSALIFPQLELAAGLPKFQFVDFLMPIITGVLILERKKLTFSYYTVFLLLFSVLIFVSMAVNHRLGILKDYFELYKFMKFLLIVLFFSTMNIPALLKKIAKPLFLIIVLFNFMHYYDLFGVNTLIYDYYNGGLSIEFFGKDSIGNATSKRIVGFMGNPNTNGIVFLFYAAYFFPVNFDKKKLYWFFSAILMLFLCQSRTSLLAFSFALCLLVLFKYTQLNWRQWLTLLIGCLLLYGVVWAFVTELGRIPSYSSGVLTGKAFESTSLTGRYETWRFLFGMIQDKPILGYGPYKDFFYENEIYAENEYILHTWRYGLFGLSAYLLLYFIPYFERVRKLVYTHRAVPTFILVIMGVSALTNNPFVEKNIMLLFALSVGAMYSMKKSNSTEDGSQYT